MEGSYYLRNWSGLGRASNVANAVDDLPVMSTGRDNRVSEIVPVQYQYREATKVMIFQALNSERVAKERR